MGALTYLRPLTGFARSRGWHRNLALRRLVFGLLSKVGSHDITMRHHWVPGAKLRLNAFRHRGYWFHGRKREHGAMLSFARLVHPGSTAIEIGGHIGYISVYLASLVGKEGRLLVMEPSPDNLHYLRRNAAGHPQITIVEQAASDRSGHATFFVENLSGQNSTLVQDYGNFSDNRQSAFSNERYRTITVETITVDALLAQRDITPDFIKIDIEGAELMALHGMHDCLEHHRPALMVEVTCDEEEVMRLLADAGYVAYDSNLKPLAPGEATGPNRFFLPQERAL